MKNRRHMMIMDIIENQVIQTQEELADELERRGQRTTQATISRDIKELRMVKATDHNGVYRYVIAASPSQRVTERQLRIFADSVISITNAQNMVVIKTISGSANAAAEAVDALHWDAVVGTIAGDNTVFLVAHTMEDAQLIVDRLQGYLK